MLMRCPNVKTDSPDIFYYWVSDVNCGKPFQASLSSYLFYFNTWFQQFDDVGMGLEFLHDFKLWSKSFPSVSVALPETRDKFPVRLKQYPHKNVIWTINVVPFSIFMATVIDSSLPWRLIAFPWATWPKAPFPMIFSIVIFPLATSDERVLGWRGAYFFISE